MNNSKTPKIVVGAGLVAVYAAAFSYLTLTDRHSVTQGDASALSAQTIAAPAAPSLGATESADTLAASAASTTEGPAPIATPAPVVAAPAAPAAAVAAKATEAPRPRVAAAPEPRVDQVPVESMPSPRVPALSDAEASSRNAGTNAVSELTDSATGEAVTSVDDASVDEPESEAAAVDDVNQ